jgi:predicted dehydrogenase
VEFDEKEKRVVNLNEADSARLDKHIPAGDAYFVELRHFIDCIQQKKPSDIVTLESAANTVRMILNNLPE